MAWLFPVILSSALVLTGCQTALPRLQKEEETEKDRYGVKTIGDYTSVGNAQPVPVGGIGLVVGLEGTGGEPANDANRSILEDDLRKEGVKNLKEVLASPNIAMVLVSAQIPPGARRGDTIDIEVQMPPRSKGTSLKGGVLRFCKLFNYDFAKNLLPDYNGQKSMLRGHDFARGEGPLLVGFNSGDDDIKQRSGRIWSGGKVMTDLPFTLMLNSMKICPIWASRPGRSRVISSSTLQVPDGCAVISVWVG